MSKFVVLYKAPQSVLEQMASATPEQMKEGMDAWMSWAGNVGDRLVDLGAPLGPAGHLGSSPGGSDDEQVCGYSIMQADSADELNEILVGHPHLQMGGSIEILEALSIPGM